jgi:two-component system, NarL family, nitrate/nitrite response regulator NarL
VSTLPIVIVEPNAVLGESLKHYLEHKGFTIAGVVESARGVADLDTPDETTVLLNGARGDIGADFAMLREVRSKARIVVYGGRSELKATLEAIQSGATVYLDEKVNALMFLRSLELATLGFVTMAVTLREEAVPRPNGSHNAGTGEVMPPPAAATGHPPVLWIRQGNGAPVRTERPPASMLSPRETSILHLLREGAPNKLIARQLSLTEATVKVHLKSILRKIRVNNRTQAAIWAMERLPASRSE